ncbi:MAG: DNA repair protein RadC [Lachnospiraceae bacterium]|nr:DNA repair protein RadC [Lachnospiraceae bacterium]MBR1523629.1 DNA repair protein RadC [Lachnospiraceae bacterium]
MNKGIKAYPASERPYERCEEYGPEALSDAELLAVILRSGKKGLDVKELALKVLKEAGGTLGGLCRLSISELSGISGIGRVKAIQLVCVAQIAKRIWKEDAKYKEPVLHVEEAAAYYMQDLRHMETEHVYVLMLDTKMRRIGEYHASIGSVNSSQVPVREIVRESLRCNAVHIILVHNHPSGDPSPSEADKEISRNLFLACRISGLSMVDSIIIGDGRYYSFREEGILN